jgi:hypothetical protein
MFCRTSLRIPESRLAIDRFRRVLLTKGLKDKAVAELLPEFIIVTRIEFEYIPVCLVVYESGGNIGSKQYPVSYTVTKGIKSFVSVINIPGLGPSKMHL